MPLPKYIDTHVFKNLHPQLHQFLQFPGTSEREKADIFNALMSRGFINVTEHHRTLVYVNNFSTIYCGLPVEAISTNEYAAKIDIDSILKTAGFRRHLLKHFPPPPLDRRFVWANTLSLLRYIRDTITVTNHPITSPYWLLENMFQFAENSRSLCLKQHAAHSS